MPGIRKSLVFRKILCVRCLRINQNCMYDTIVNLILYFRSIQCIQIYYIHQNTCNSFGNNNRRQDYFLYWEYHIFVFDYYVVKVSCFKWHYVSNCLYILLSFDKTWWSFDGKCIHKVGNKIFLWRNLVLIRFQFRWLIFKLLLLISTCICYNSTILVYKHDLYIKQFSQQCLFESCSSIYREHFLF